MDKRIVVKRVKKFPLFDIFQGHGWKNWTRVMVSKEGTIQIIGGAKLPAKFLKYIMETYAPKGLNAST